MKRNKLVEFLRVLWAYRPSLILYLTPFLLLPVPLYYEGKAGRCAYGVAIMAVYWCTEALPMAVTALLPILLFPWLGVLGSGDLCKNYLRDTNFLFFGGLLIAVAVEKCNLHKRIALKVLTLVGSQPRWLILGFMCTTAFLSMWLSNTATAAMLMPIARAVLHEMNIRRLEGFGQLPEDGQAMGRANIAYIQEVTHGEAEEKLEDLVQGTSRLDTQLQAQNKDPANEQEKEEIANSLTNTILTIALPDYNREQSDREFHNISAGLLISIAFAANIGGTATLTGTGPNIVLKGVLDTTYPEASEVNYGSWFVFGLCNAIMCVLVTWLLLMVVFTGLKKTFHCSRKAAPHEVAAQKVVEEEYRKLGQMSFAEVMVLILFICQALLWFTREPVFMPGWAQLFFLEPGFVTDASVGVSVALLLFFLPQNKPKCFTSSASFSNDSCSPAISSEEVLEPPPEEGQDEGPSPAILTWEDVHEKMAWSVIILLGGSFAMADAVQVSGLSEDIGRALSSLGALHPSSLVVLLCVVTAVVTNFTSNTATATIFLPIVGELAEEASINPLYVMVPVAVTASLAFVLPVATPPNAIVFAFGDTKISDMVKSGIPVNIACVALLQLSVNTFGKALFSFDDLPAWMEKQDMSEHNNSSTIDYLGATSGLF